MIQGITDKKFPILNMLKVCGLNLQTLINLEVINHRYIHYARRIEIRTGLLQL